MKTKLLAVLFLILTLSDCHYVSVAEERAAMHDTYQKCLERNRVRLALHETYFFCNEEAYRNEENK